MYSISIKKTNFALFRGVLAQPKRAQKVRHHHDSAAKGHIGSKLPAEMGLKPPGLNPNSAISLDLFRGRDFTIWLNPLPGLNPVPGWINSLLQTLSH